VLEIIVIMAGSDEGREKREWRAKIGDGGAEKRKLK
jgi:hypothetical protein